MKRISVKEDVEELRSVWEQARGLMFKRAEANKVYLFQFQKKRSGSFHMFFVPKAIDIVFLDDGWVVVDLKKGFKPWTIYKPKREYSRVLEAKEGFIKKNNIRLGTIIRLPKLKSKLSDK